MRTIEADFAMTLVGETAFVVMATPALQHRSSDTLSITLDGTPVSLSTSTGLHGARQLQFSAGAGELRFSLRSWVAGRADATPSTDVAPFLASSRYCDVDALRDFASERFGNADGWVAVDAIAAWIRRSFSYEPSLSAIDDTASDTITKRGGMCRDWAHATIALCRAAGIPARYVSVYAPGLNPPDFHAVCEVLVDGEWWVIDTTGLAPRGSMVRIATGVDAGDAAWATNTINLVTLTSVRVRAYDDELAAGARDDPAERIRLS